MAIKNDGARADWNDKLCLTDVLLRCHRNFCDVLKIQRRSRPIMGLVEKESVRELGQSDLVSKSGEGVENSNCAASGQITQLNGGHSTWVAIFIQFTPQFEFTFAIEDRDFDPIQVQQL